MRGRKARVQPTERTTVGYVRVSTLDQAENGVSLDAQESRIAAYATALGWQVSEIIRDAGESAKSLKRPGIAKVLSGVQAGAIGRVITLKLDRVTRSMRDLSSLLDVFAKADASLVSVSESLDTQSAAGRLVVNMLGVVAEWERLAIGERTAQALAHKRRCGKVYSGRTPFGYHRDGDKLVGDVAQQRALAQARSMHAAGASLRQIAARLESLGVKPNNGGSKWYAQSVKHILTSKMTSDAA
jgi:site-specific DNA recombinase